MTSISFTNKPFIQFGEAYFSNASFASASYNITSAELIILTACNVVKSGLAVLLQQEKDKDDSI